MQLSDAVIDHLIRELKAFRQQHPLASELNDTYQSAPVELMVRTFLNVFLDPARTEEAADTIARTALDNGIPYAVLLGDINVIKQALLTHYRGQNDNPVDLFEKLDTAFETTKNAIARRYLIDLAGQNGLFSPHARVRNQRLLEIYDHWFGKLRRALIEDDLRAFEHLAHNNVRFLETLEHPETLMVCMDANACREVHDSHRDIMRQAVLLYIKLLERRYEQAYLLYAELRAAVKQLAALLTTLYFNYETNQLSLFFNLLENVGYTRRHAYLTLINVRNLNRINQLHGEEKGDELLQRVERALQKLVAGHHAHLAYVRGLLGDFYLVSLGLEGTALQALLEEWAGGLEEIDLSITSVNLRRLKFLDRPNLRLLIHYLHQQREHTRLLLETAEDIRPVNRWIARQLEATVNLRKLLDPEHLFIHVQPLVDTQSGEIAAFEVLGRLQNGDQTLSAGIFIDRLIELGLIERFDSLILEAISAEADALAQLTDTVFINCSPASLRSGAYLERLQQACAGPLRKLNIVVELTEQTMLEQPQMVIDLHRQAGLRFAIDDFGTGYSSLRSVVELAETGAVRYLKIDGSLTQQVTRSGAIRRLFQVIHRMADDLNLKTVAEFIEDQDTLSFLRDERIDYGQGFFLGKPMPVRAWLVQKLYQVD